MAPPTTTTASEASNPPANDVSVLPKRALWGVVGLVGLTVGSLGLAWLFPNATLLHFLWVAQAVPVLYLILVWWGIQTPQPNDDAS
jgi:hypothetical protein